MIATERAISEISILEVSEVDDLDEGTPINISGRKSSRKNPKFVNGGFVPSAVFNVDKKKKKVNRYSKMQPEGKKKIMYRHLIKVGYVPRRKGKKRIARWAANLKETEKIAAFIRSQITAEQVFGNLGLNPTFDLAQMAFTNSTNPDETYEVTPTKAQLMKEWEENKTETKLPPNSSFLRRVQKQDDDMEI